MTPLEKAYSHVSRLLADAFRLRVLYFSYPYENLEEIDQGFRDMVWADYSMESDSDNWFGRGNLPEGYHLYLVKSSLSFYNIIAMHVNGSNPDFISVGPFQEEEPIASFLKQISQGDRLTPEFIAAIKQFYASLPLANPDDVITLLRHVLEIFIPEFMSVEPIIMNFEDNSHSFRQVSDKLEIYTLRSSEKYAAHLRSVQTYIEKADNEKAADCLSKFLSFCGITERTSIQTLRESLWHYNSYCCHVLLGSTVHPVHSLQLLRSFDNRIRSEVSPKSLMKMFYELTRKYCLLIKNYSLSQYSYLIRSIISYVDLHLADSLSLDTIADYFGKNPAYLSAKFSKEVGESLTVYIQKARIHAAMKYLNEGEKSISEIAELVGINDYGYFSKLFKKYTGHSPSEYRKSIRS